MSSVELFIYYRALPAHAAEIGSAVRTLQARLCVEWPGLRARLLCRPETRDGLQTWMEVYVLPPGAAADAAERAIEDTAGEALARWLAGPRHVERFVACA